MKLFDNGVYLIDGTEIISSTETEKLQSLNRSLEYAEKGTITYSILKNHNTSDSMDKLKIKFDSMASHDITFVGVIQTAKASGMEKFPLPYVLTNCHNSLCAVGGTINEDDHLFGLSAAKKYGGIYVPPHLAVIHQYMREEMAGCGKMIIGSDSHTRYGALGTMAIGEGGGELVKQLLESTYDIDYPEVVAVYLDNTVQPGVGPQDVALAIIGEVFEKGFVKNRVMEFVGPGVHTMSTDYRNGVDVMTTETTCLSSIWTTDDDTREFLKIHHREDDYRELKPKEVAYYDRLIYVDLSKIKPMIALPFHPSNTYTIDELRENPADIFAEIEKKAKKILDPRVQFTLQDKIVDGKIQVQQGIIAGCSGGTYSSIMAAADILKGKETGHDAFNLSVYPSSQAVFMDLLKRGKITELMATGATVKTAFCGPCFGAGDTPTNNSLSIRHVTRNFPNREGSKPGDRQISGVALMDARSVAATAANKGILTPATDMVTEKEPAFPYEYDDSPYRSRVYQGFQAANSSEELVYGPNIKDWPEIQSLKQNILLRVTAKIMDEVTTTDELIPSGETSSYRSNPIGLAEFTLSRRDPEYVKRAKAVRELEEERQAGKLPAELDHVYQKIHTIDNTIDRQDIQIGSTIYAKKPGDGSAREQAASCQRVLGALANICEEYATKRYRSNVMNWGMLPFQLKGEPPFGIGDYIFVPNILDALDGSMESIKAYVIGETIQEIELYISEMTSSEKEIVKAGCLINYNRKGLTEK